MLIVLVISLAASTVSFVTLKTYLGQTDDLGGSYDYVAHCCRTRCSGGVLSDEERPEREEMSGQQSVAVYVALTCAVG